jgi:MFS transporter, PAT family, beta-lactamase induction signal transducer AmpG
VTAHETVDEDIPSAASTPPKTLLETLVTYFEPRIIAVLFMGFSSGLPLALTGDTLKNWMTRDGVDLGTIGFFALVAVAYSLKFVWAPFMDRLLPPWPMRALGRRRGWAIWTQIAMMISIVLLGFTDPTVDLFLTVLFAVFVAFFSASQDIVIDAYRIELLDDHQQGAGAAITQWGYRLGMLASGAGALWLRKDGQGLSWPVIYLIMAALVGVGVVTVLLTREPKVKGKAKSSILDTKGWYVLPLVAVAASAVGAFLLVKFVIFAGVVFSAWFSWIPNVTATVSAAAVPVVIILALPKPRPAGARSSSAYSDLYAWLEAAVIAPFRDMTRHQGWGLILCFIVLYKFGDAFAGGMASPFYVQTGFSDEEIAWVSKLFGVFATLFGVLIGGFVVARLGFFGALMVGGIVQMFSNLMFAWQAVVGNDVDFLMLTIAIENISGGIGSAAFVAYLSALCNVAFTGTQYALFSSLASIGRTVLSSPGGEVVKLVGWYDFFVVSTFVALPGLILLLWMMRRYPMPSSSRVARAL